MMDDNYCWNLHTVGRGEGYYITNGYAVPIQWSKPDRYSKTVYTYADGNEINVSDGRTYIEVSDVTMTVEVEQYNRWKHILLLFNNNGGVHCEQDNQKT